MNRIDVNSVSFLSTLVLGAVLLLGSAATTAAPRFGEETVTLELGGFLSDFDTEVALKGPNGGSTIDLEDELGLDSDQSTFRGELTWRFAPRHRVMLGYYNFDRSAIGSANRQIEIDDPDNGLIEIDVGVSVKGNFDWELIPVSYAYSFYKTDATELAASLGAHWVSTGFGAKGTFKLNGQQNTVVAQSESVSGPLPVFGLEADHAITRDWHIGAHAQYFTLDYDDYSGELLDLRVQTEYWFAENFGAGLGYTWYDIDLTVDKGNGYKLRGDFDYGGLEAYVTFRF